MVERFEREAKIAARLQHENLVGVIDVGTTDDGQKLMVLEFAPGTTSPISSPRRCRARA